MPILDTNATSELLSLVRTEARESSPRELLNLSPKVLLGVSTEAATLLEALDIHTIFDLATSSLFNAATQLLLAGNDLKNVLYRHGQPTSDLVREQDAAGKKVDELQSLSIHALKSLPENKVATAQKVLDVQTIRDLALYPPYKAAVRMLNAVYFPENTPGFDGERPADLVPKSGEYPIERVQYTTLLMGEIQTNERDTITNVANNDFKPIDIGKLSVKDAGFQKIAFGALLTFTQSWYAQGVALGQLLHSTSLAPGESTRIAVIDWSRKSRAGETEVISEVDDLTNDTSRNRSITEVTQAVATDAQEGFSSANSNSVSTQKGTSSAMEMSAPLGGLFGGPSGSMGSTSSTATTATHADSYSTSFGRRDIATSMTQNINDRTHQHAHSNRSRRASVIKEVSQKEHEEVSTRIIANYNHMHALTMQYYEVVQIYYVEVALVKADRVVFIPIQLVDFNNDALIRRFQKVLSNAALTFEIRDALRNLDMLEIAPNRDTHFTILDASLKKFASSATMVRYNKAIEPKVAPAADAVTTPAVAATLQLSNALPIVSQINDGLWQIEQTAKLSNLLNFPVLRANSNAIYLPTDVSVEAASIASSGVAMKLQFHMSQGTTRVTVSADNPIPLAEVTKIGITGSSTERDISVVVTLTINRNGVRFPIELPAVTVTKGAANETTIVQIKPGGVNANLKQHLNDNRMYYSQAIFRGLDTTDIAWLLSGYGVEVNGRLVPVAQVVEPAPIRYIGNYLAFKMNTDASTDESWSVWLRDHGIRIGHSQIDIVPLATGGTFAEAVLGRSNSAEKLDITRFWNWQDSPPLLQPTEIAAINTGSRATPDDTHVGQLSNPIINITTPTSLPDPMGTAAILSAIQNGGMFRDMSGLQGTIGLAQAALQATSAGAATAGQQAGTNMNSLLQANTERQRIAAEMITSLAQTAASAYTGGAVSGGRGISPSSNHSQDGAKINYFDKTQGQSSGGGSASNGSGPAPVTASGQSSSGGGSASNGSAGNNGSGYSQNPAALAATWGGDNQPRSGFVDKLVDKVSGVFGTDESPTSPLTNRQAWPKLDSTTVLTRINDLKGNATLFNQGSVGLCTAAAFFHHIIQRNPSEFESFAKALYGAGVGFLNKMKIAPGSDLRNTDYAKLAAKYPNLPPQADWMLMSSLRDSENWLFDYEGSPDETFSMSTSAKEMSEWYNKTGLYTSVAYDDESSLAKIKGIKKTNKNHIGLWVKEGLLQPGKGSHIITLESAFTIDEPNNKITFDYWTWAQPVKTMSTSLSTFVANYLGVITASF